VVVTTYLGSSKEGYYTNCCIICGVWVQSDRRVDYFDTYASVMNGKSFRIPLALYNSSEEYSMQHWDVKQAFVNAPIEETVYVHQIKGCEKEGEERSVLRLKKALYGTKQAAAAWQKHLAQILVSEGGRRNLKDECVFIFNECGGVCVIGTHVDDLFVLSDRKGEKIRDKVLKKLQEGMEIDNRGEISYALDMCIETDRERGILKISQHIKNLIHKFQLSEAKGKETPGVVNDELTTEHIPKTQKEQQEVGKLPIRELIGGLWW